LSDHGLGLAGSGKQLMHQLITGRESRTGNRARRAASALLPAPDRGSATRFLNIVPIDCQVGLKLLRAVLKALGVVIRNAALPEIRGQGRVQMFGTIKVIDRCRYVPELERRHPPLDVKLCVIWVGFEDSREALDFTGHG
jgi:hypothetical protein